jgi:hypothetical protein
LTIFYAHKSENALSAKLRRLEKMTHPMLTKDMEEDEAKNYQRWLWYQLDRGKTLSTLDPTQRWCHDDNMEAQPLKFMIVIPVNGTIPQLFSLEKSRKPHQVYRKIVAMAEHGDALCKKAVAFLVQQKFKYPTHRFLHAQEDAEWYSKQ